MPPEWLKDVILPVVGFMVGIPLGLFLPQVQGPLAEYRKTLTKISHMLIREILVMIDQYELNPTTKDQQAAKDKLDALHKKFKDLHAQLLSCTSTLPQPSVPLLRLLRLVRPHHMIQKGAAMLIGISNQIIQPKKDLPHLHTLIKELGVALDIDVGN